MISVRHVGIVVTDLKAALYFYCDLLGLKEAPVKVEAGPFLEGLLAFDKAHVHTVKLTAFEGPTLVELLAFDEPRPLPKTPLNAVGPTHIALTVDDLQNMYERLLKAGVPFNAPPRQTPDGLAVVAYCQDPDGTFIELVEPKKR